MQGSTTKGPSTKGGVRPVKPATSAAAAAAKPPAAKRGAARRGVGKPGEVRVRCKESKTTMDLTGGTGKRFFQLDTLQNAIQGHLSRGESWLTNPLRECLRGSVPVTMALDLRWENSYAMTFEATPASTTGKSGKLMLVVAKNHQEHGERLRGEIEALRELAPRCADAIAPVIAEGTFYFPPKIQTQGKGRQVLACLRTWPGPCMMTEFRPEGQYVLVNESRRLLSRAESESYGASIARLFLRSFDALTRSGPSLNSIHWEDVLCRSLKTAIGPGLVHCSRLTRYRSIQAYLKGLLLWEPDKDSGVYPMQAVDPVKLARVMRDALGEELATEAVRRLSATGGEASVEDEYMKRLREAMLA